MRLILTVTLLFLTCSALAQERPSSYSKSDFKIIEESEPTEDGEMTFVNLERMLIESPDSLGTPIEFTASFAYVTKDKKPLVWPIVTLAFTSRAAKSRFPDNPNVTFLIDSTPIKIRSVEAAERGGDIVTTFAEPGVEWLDMMLSQKTFAAIVVAKNVEVQIGQLKFSFQDKHMEALRELARRMTLLQTRITTHSTRPDGAFFLSSTCPYRCWLPAG